MGRHTHHDRKTRPRHRGVETIPGQLPARVTRVEQQQEATEARAERESWTPNQLFNRHCAILFQEHEDKHGRPPEGEERRTIRARVRLEHPELAHQSKTNTPTIGEETTPR